MRTAFQEKVQPRPGMALDGVDTQTRDLFSRFQRHFEQVFCKAAQDPEDVTEVGDRQGSGSWELGQQWDHAQCHPAPSPSATGLPHRAASLAASPALL